MLADKSCLSVMAGLFVIVSGCARPASVSTAADTSPASGTESEEAARTPKQAGEPAQRFEWSSTCVYAELETPEEKIDCLLSFGEPDELTGAIAAPLLSRANGFLLFVPEKQRTAFADELLSLIGPRVLAEAVRAGVQSRYDAAQVDAMLEVYRGVDPGILAAASVGAMDLEAIERWFAETPPSAERLAKAEQLAVLGEPVLVAITQLPGRVLVDWLEREGKVEEMASTQQDLEAAKILMRGHVTKGVAYVTRDLTELQLETLIAVGSHESSRWFDQQIVAAVEAEAVPRVARAMTELLPKIVEAANAHRGGSKAP